MKKCHYLCMLLSLVITDVHAKVLVSDVPMIVSTVTSKRVGEQLIRVIEYYTEKRPLSIELISPPKMILRQKLDITSIKVDWFGNGQDRLLKFSESQAVNIDENIKITKDGVYFSVFYVGGGPHAGSIDADCSVAIKPDKLEEPVCKEKAKK